MPLVSFIRHKYRGKVSATKVHIRSFWNNSIKSRLSCKRNIRSTNAHKRWACTNRLHLNSRVDHVLCPNQSMFRWHQAVAFTRVSSYSAAPYRRTPCRMYTGLPARISRSRRPAIPSLSATRSRPPREFCLR